MAVLEVITTWYTDTVRTAKRVPQSLGSWAHDHVTEVLGSGVSTNAASGYNGPFTATVVWSHTGTTFTSELVDYDTEAELLSAVAALKSEIIAQGGTIISG